MPHKTCSLKNLTCLQSSSKISTKNKLRMFAENYVIMIRKSEYKIKNKRKFLHKFVCLPLCDEASGSNLFQLAISRRQRADDGRQGGEAGTVPVRGSDPRGELRRSRMRVRRKHN